MFCDRCGTRLNDTQSFCMSCGKAAGTVPLMPARGRIGGHIRLLGILWLALSAFRLLPGLLLMAMFRHGTFDFLPPDVPFFVHHIIRGAGVLPKPSAGRTSTKCQMLSARLRLLRESACRRRLLRGWLQPVFSCLPSLPDFA